MSILCIFAVWSKQYAQEHLGGKELGFGGVETCWGGDKVNLLAHGHEEPIEGALLLCSGQPMGLGPALCVPWRTT